MTEGNFNTVRIPQLREYFKSAQCCGFSDEFQMLHLAVDTPMNTTLHPCRFDGVMIIFCMRGNIRMNINLQEFEVKENSVFINLPGNTTKLSGFDKSQDAGFETVILAMNSDFANNMRIDINKAFSETLTVLDKPVLNLGKDEAALFCSHIQLIKDLAGSAGRYAKESVHSIMSSIFYGIAGLWAAHVSESRAKDTISTNRNRLLFEQFLRLVNEYHTVHRKVGFYADRLCLTPKYLSKLIKTTSGKSAPEWIDEYVILEAKNLLKYSSISIKEIVYKLHFPNQSVFYKFFKAHTGLTPSEYRNGR